MNENNETTLKEKAKRFIDEYGFILPVAIGLTALNTISISRINRELKAHNKKFEISKECFNTVHVAGNMICDELDKLSNDISLLKVAVGKGEK